MTRRTTQRHEAPRPPHGHDPAALGALVTTTPLDPARSAPLPDLTRGLAVVFVVVSPIDVPSVFHVLSQEARGPIAGAEMFVALSGVVVGLAYRSRALRGVRGEALEPLWRRARMLYVVTLAVVV